VSEKNKIYLGIDLGTTNSSVSFLLQDPRNLAAKMLPVKTVAFEQDDEEDKYDCRFPSLLAIKGKKQILTGWRAYNYLKKGDAGKDLRKGKNLFYSTKSDLTCGTIYPFSVDKKLNKPKAVITKLLKDILKETENKIPGFNILNCRFTLTVPASLGYEARKETIEALTELDIKKEHINLIDEPTAALISFINDQQAGINLTSDKPKKVLVFDYGGGTLDLCLFECTLSSRNSMGVKLIPLAISSYNQNGGDEIDRRIMQSIVWPELDKEKKGWKKRFKENKLRQIEDNLTFLIARPLKERICNAIAKTQKNKTGETDISVTFKLSYEEAIDQIGEQIQPIFKLSKKEFDQILEPFFCTDSSDSDPISIFKPITDCCKKVGIDVEDIDIVLLNGGSCKNPLIMKKLKEGLNMLAHNEFKTSVLEVPDLSLSVAIGAAVHCYYKNERKCDIADEIVAEEIGVIDVNRTNYILTEAGSEIPYPAQGQKEMLHEFITTSNNQKNLLIPFYVGSEYGDVSASRVISFLLPNNISKNTPVRIKYNIDKDKVFHWMIKIGNNDYSLLDPIIDPWTKNRDPTYFAEITKAKLKVTESLNTSGTLNISELYKLALLLFSQGDMREAEALLCDMLENNIENFNIHNLLAIIYSKKNEKIYSQDHEENSLKLAPLNAVLLGNAGIRAIQRGDRDNGISKIRRALEINPKHPYLYEQLGDILLKDNHINEAHIEYKEAIKYLGEGSDPRQRAEYEMLERLYRKIGKYDEAASMKVLAERLRKHEEFGGDPKNIIAPRLNEF
jgi:molecular chaperone DnaK (HSP70)